MPNAAERALSRERLRRRREALLLELGGLVYELHRHGQRSPELLQRKAAELEALEQDERAGEGEAAGEREAADPHPCPACGERVDRGQLVCLNCGSRLDLGRRPGNLLGTAAALIAVVVVGAVAFGFALSELTGGSDEGEAQRSAELQAEREPPAPAAENGGQQAPSETQPEPRPKSDAEGSAQQPRRSLLLEWPQDLTAHTVVLVTTSDRPAAGRLAREAAQSGIEAGLLRAEDYDLGSGLWLVFAGRFDTRRGAVRQAANLDERYPGAYVQLIEPVG